MCTTMCNNFHDYLDLSDVTYGTYGVPTSFTTRLSAITGYVYGYYMNSGAYVHTIFSSTDSIVDSPAGECASNAANFNSTYYDVLLYGCPCNGTGMIGDVKCTKGTLHHNNVFKFQLDLPEYNPSNECAVYLTTSTLCHTEGTTHRDDLNGVAIPGAMAIVVRDTDYCFNNSTDNPYAYARATMVHEVGHLYNVEDHYGDLASGDSDPDCIWGDNRNFYDIVKTCSTCSTCHSTIINNRNKFHHTS